MEKFVNIENMEKLFASIRQLQKIRQGVPQLLFCEDVAPLQTIAVRQSILELKKSNASCTEIDFIINSPGGLADEAYKVIRTLRHNFETVNIIVPFWAKSAATLLSLGGSKIVMDEFGEFGPLDAQLGKVRDDSPEMDRESALNDEHSLRRIETRFMEMFETMFIRLFEHKKINIPKAELSQQLLENLSKFYEPLLKQIDPYKLGDKRRKLDIGGQYAKRILAQFGPKMDNTKNRVFVDFLVDGCPDHGYVIDFDLIKIFLNNVVTSENAFGKEYADKLSEISLIFIEDSIDPYIGFIDPIETLEESKKDVTFDAEILDVNRVVNGNGHRKVNKKSKNSNINSNFANNN